jgi:hypothetical protein
MTALKEITLSICCLCIVVALIDILIPQNSYKTSLKLLTGAVILFTVLTPFGGDFSLIKTDYHFRQLDIDEITGNINERIAKAASDKAGAEIESIMKKHNAEGEIKIFADITEQGSINIERAVIELSQPPRDTQLMIDEIKEKTGITADIKE